MPLIRPRSLHVALAALLLAVVPACGEDEEEPGLPRICGVDLPPPGYEQDDYITTKEPASPPHDKVTYRWTCLEGWLVDETWKRDADGCWVRDGEYRRENPNCPRTR